MKIFGYHLLIDIYQPMSKNNLKDVAIKAALDASLDITDVAYYNFEPQGESVVVLIKESHISLHSWPEEKYIAADIFTCSSIDDAFKALSSMLKCLKPKQVHLTIHERR